MSKLTDITFGDILKAYWNDEGWHRVYKKYGHHVLMRENYRWKRKIMKRFGPNNKMSMRLAIKERDTMWSMIRAEYGDKCNGRSFLFSLREAAPQPAESSEVD